jgi:hypothetical protein
MVQLQQTNQKNFPRRDISPLFKIPTTRPPSLTIRTSALSVTAAIHRTPVGEKRGHYHF